YAQSFRAPVHRGQRVLAVDVVAGRFAVRTEDRTWRADSVVIATGWSDQPYVPVAASGLDPAIAQVTPNSYRNPAQLAPGGVLVVGASATGVQLADELARAGRQVVLAVGSHSRSPRRYRGLDIWWWLDRIGALAATI